MCENVIVYMYILLTRITARAQPVALYVVKVVVSAIPLTRITQCY